LAALLVVSAASLASRFAGKKAENLEQVDGLGDEIVALSLGRR
jgi:hypothetical protein